MRLRGTSTKWSSAMSKNKSAGIADAESTVSDELESLVTPEMIEAGLCELFSFNHEKNIPEDAVKSIFVAMLRLYNPSMAQCAGFQPFG